MTIRNNAVDALPPLHDFREDEQFAALMGVAAKAFESLAKGDTAPTMRAMRLLNNYLRGIIRAAVEADRAQRPEHCRWPTCESEAKQEEIAAQAYRELYSGEGGADRAQQGDPVAMSDEEIESAFKAAFGQWDGNRWVIEDADLHPFVRGILYRAATKAAAPADAPIVRPMDDPKMAEYLRGQPWISAYIETLECELRKANRAAPVPDTGIPTIDTPEFNELLDEFAYRASERRALGGDFGSAEAEDKAASALIAHIDSFRAPVSGTPTSGAVEKADWTSVSDRLPEVGKLVMVYSPPTKYDHPGEVNIGFDCIDPNDDDHASWLGHNEHYEHFCCVAKPEGSTGPSEKAPYTHWMPLPAAPQPSEAKAGEDA